MAVAGDTWFDDLPVLGALPRDKALVKLREVGEDKFIDQIEGRLRDTSSPVDAFGTIHLLPERAWQHTSHAFGYISATMAGQTEPLAIQYAGNIPADKSLKNSRIKITLDRLRIADYPGSGTHLVLFDFYAQNQVSANVEHLHFNASFPVREGEQVAVIGYPIFVGLNVGTEGVVFKCFTVNVKNESDKALLDFLNSDVFKGGLKLVSAIQPAIGLLSTMAFGLTKAVAARSRNVPVQNFFMGLDFSSIPHRARLCEGSYVAVQIPEASKIVWDWNEWIYNLEQGQIVSSTDPKRLIPYNYIVFGVSRYEGD